MERFIANENVKRFRTQLDECTDEQQRETLKSLLAEAEARLAELNGKHAPAPLHRVDRH